MKGKVSNLAALALTDSWIQVSGDSSYLGTIRTPSKATEGGLVLTDDAAITTLSLWTDRAAGLPRAVEIIRPAARFRAMEGVQQGGTEMERTRLLPAMRAL